MDYPYRVPPSFVCWFLTHITHSYIYHKPQNSATDISTWLAIWRGPILYPINLCVFFPHPRVTGSSVAWTTRDLAPAHVEQDLSPAARWHLVIWCRWSLGFTRKTQRKKKCIRLIADIQNLEGAHLYIWQPTKTVVVSGNQTGLAGKSHINGGL